MKRLILSSLVVLATALVQAQEQPKLVVGIIVDQMRTDYIYRYWDKYEEGGFKTLLAEGYFFRNTHFNYIPTYTGPGHASVYTGTTPMNHGIIANYWYDKKSGKGSYCVGDSTVSSIGTSNDKGQMSPSKMLAPSIGDAIRISSNFKGKSIGISIKDRGAILPAGHSANAAYWLDYETGRMISSSYYMSELPKWVKKFNSEKHCDQLAKTPWTTSLALEKYTESTADNTAYEHSLIEGQDPVFPYDVSRSIEQNTYYGFATTPYGNSLLRMFADKCLINEDLGQDEHMDLLAISFSSPDMIGHSYGPQSIEVEDTYIKLDREIAELIDALNTRVGEGNYLLFLTADHAAAQVPSYLADHNIPVGYFNGDAFKAGLETRLKEEFGVDNLVLSFSNQQLFLNHDLMRAQKLEFKKVAQSVREYAHGIEGVSNTLNFKDLQHPLPPNMFAKMAANGWNPQRSGDIVLQLLPGWMDYRPQGTTHGSSFNYDSHVPLIFYGFGVPQGESIEAVEITQIAPTVSLLSRIAFPDVSDHRPLRFN